MYHEDDDVYRDDAQEGEERVAGIEPLFRLGILGLHEDLQPRTKHAEGVDKVVAVDHTPQDSGFQEKTYE